ncbi:MAG: hypothetical protein HFE04_01650 [Bacilli bacterium]|nr:hypothetical protein [Bacilli bacterium]
MEETKTKEVLNVDYIYIPYENKKDVTIRENKIIYKNDTIIENLDKKEYSPVSGIFNGIGEINTTTGPKNVIIIENDFKDTVEKKKISIEDIYKLKSETIKKIWKPKSSEITLEIKSIDTEDLKDEFILKDNMSIILQTLDILNQTYPDIEIKISLEKNNIRIYQALFSYLGTYPNITVEFGKPHIESTKLTTYDVIDIYNELKNCNIRDYIYITLIKNQEFDVIKTKKNTNLKDLLETLDINANKATINGNIKLSGINFLINEEVYKININ